MAEISFTKEQAQEFVHAYDLAMWNEEPTFEYNGQKLLTAFAGYIVEMLEDRLGPLTREAPAGYKSRKVVFTMTSGHSIEELGFLPQMLDGAIDTPVAEQINNNYQHGGGWRSFTGFIYSPTDRSIRYTGDPKLYPIAHARINNETVLVYPYSWVLVLQEDGSFDIARID